MASDPGRIEIAAELPPENRGRRIWPRRIMIAGGALAAGLAAYTLYDHLTSYPALSLAYSDLDDGMLYRGDNSNRDAAIKMATDKCPPGGHCMTLITVDSGPRACIRAEYSPLKGTHTATAFSPSERQSYGRGDLCVSATATPEACAKEITYVCNHEPDADMNRFIAENSQNSTVYFSMTTNAHYSFTPACIMDGNCPSHSDDAVNRAAKEQQTRNGDKVQCLAEAQVEFTPPYMTSRDHNGIGKILSLSNSYSLAVHNVRRQCYVWDRTNLGKCDPNLQVFVECNYGKRKSLELTPVGP